ncbi:MAG: 3'-5' exonuclease [Bacteroidales bacterium]
MTNNSISLFPDITNLRSEDITQYPTKKFTGNIHVIDNKNQINDAVTYLTSCSILGFDTETKPSFKKGISYSISLLQLSDDKNAFLFRIQKCGFPRELQKILSSPNILKIGAAIHDDLKSLKKINYFKPQGFIDIQNIAKELEIEQVGLKNLCPLVLGFRISKRQQLSNWESDNLRTAQQTYAATDAWVCYLLYLKLNPYIL